MEVELDFSTNDVIIELELKLFHVVNMIVLIFLCVDKMPLQIDPSQYIYDLYIIFITDLLGYGNKSSGSRYSSEKNDTNKVIQRCRLVGAKLPRVQKQVSGIGCWSCVSRGC